MKNNEDKNKPHFVPMDIGTSRGKYNPREIEPKWMEKWEKADIYRAIDPDTTLTSSRGLHPRSRGASARGELCKKPKKYILVEFPYPSGEKLHVGHAFSFTGTDVFARFNRMKGFNVLCPMGWDAFGLPAENYAIKMGVNPAVTTAENIANAKQQAKSWGLSVDWSREVSTTDPKYYRWTQWIFLQWYKRGLAHKEEKPINWCPSCKTGLANEEVVSGNCERCGSETTKRNIKQWVIDIAKYGDRLIDGLKKTDFVDKAKKSQINWIGRSEGAEVKFKILRSKDSKIQNDELTVFTTRADTLYGVTFMVISPEHPLVQNLTTNENKDKVEDYVAQAGKKSDLERTELQKDKNGVFTGSYVINPINGKEIPLWVADYALITYGTGIVMGVPAHDQRDFDFAKKYGFEIVPVIQPEGKWNFNEKPYTDVESGKTINCIEWDNLKPSDAIEKANKWIEQKGIGKKTVTYHLRDWIFSRQHYWGEPVPIIFCDKCGEVPVPNDQLPVTLPNVKSYKPTDTGESPLAAISDWVNVKCPSCGSDAKRETDTMPNWAGSDWYYLAYCFANKLEDKKLKIKNQNSGGDIFSENKDILKYWLPVDVYVGGDEHNVLHLLYSRFTYQFLFDLGVLPKEIPEPYYQRISHGVILGPDSQRMSKSHGNVINPDEVVEGYGADAMRLYMMFIGPFDATMSWNQDGLEGSYRFLKRVWNLVVNYKGDKGEKGDRGIERKLHQTIKKVTEDIEEMKFNTAIASLMEMLNTMTGGIRGEDTGERVTREMVETYLKLLAPFAPFMTEELWEKLGNKFSIHQSEWPKYDTNLLEEDEVVIVIQVNGKTRDQITIEGSILRLRSGQECKVKEEVEFIAREREKVKPYLAGGVKRVVFVPGKLINFVV